MPNRESYGVDIANTQSEESSYHTDDDEYEDSFIDDDEHQKISPSPVSSNKGIFYRHPRQILSVFHNWMLILYLVHLIYLF